MPDRGDAVEPRAERAPEPRFRRPRDDEIVRAARRLVRGSRASYASQNEFRDALTAYLRREDPLATVGGKRLRRLLVGIPGVRLSVHYTEREDPRPLSNCPVCGAALRPIRNRTLGGEDVILGQRCTRCDYWTHRTRRIPTRYRVSSARSSSRSAD